VSPFLEAGKLADYKVIQTLRSFQQASTFERRRKR
jgi:hypothetical protein